MGRLSGKVCVITGAAGGQGEVCVERFSQEGAKILASDLAADASDTLRAKCVVENDFHYVCGDVTEEQTLRHIVEEAVEKFGRIDVLFNNHGAMVGSPFLEHTMEELDLVLNVNVRATFRLTQLVAQRMVSQGNGGSIINNSSSGGLIGFPDMSGYGMSKAGVAQLARSLANDLKEHKIRVNAICPGAIDTQMPHRYLEKFADKKAEIWKAMEDA
ncbi:MAG: SDR family oxidoreductase, partial [Pseudomonadota bacterium]